MFDTPLEVSSIKIFLEVAADCSMTRAADTLGLTQPAISNVIKKMEKSLGVELFTRETRPMQLTKAGRALYNRGPSLIKEINRLAETIALAGSCGDLDLRLGCSDGIAANLIPYIFEDLRKATETLFITSGTSPYVVDLLKRKAIDIALSTDPLTKEKNILSSPLFSEEFLLVVPNKKEFEKKSVEELKPLLEHLPFLGFPSDTMDFFQVERIYRALGLKGTRKISFGSKSGMMSVISNGDGWSIQPALALWSTRIFKSKLRLVPFMTNKATRSFFITYYEELYAPMAELITREIKNALTNQLFCSFEKEYPELLGHVYVQE